jgi:hypothetical protein
LKGIHELEGVNIAKVALDMGINDKLRQAKDFSTQVECIPETRLLLLFIVSILLSQMSTKGNIEE